MRRVAHLVLSVSLFGAALLFMSCKSGPVESGEKRGPPWVVFTRENGALISDAVNALVVDYDGGIWIATDGGASNFSRGNWSNLGLELEYQVASGSSRKVAAMAVGVDRSLWFGLVGGGVRRWNRYNATSEPWTTYSTPLLTSSIVYSMECDNAGNIWIGTSRGASRFKPGPTSVDPNSGLWTQYISTNSLVPDEAITSMMFNPYDNTIWFGTYSNGVVWYDGDQYWNFDRPLEQPFPVSSIIFVPGDIAWMGTSGDWAYRYAVQTSEWTHFGDTASVSELPSNFVGAVVSDYRGIVWFGTRQGLTKFDGQQWSTFTQSNSQLPSNTITALAIDANGNLWIGTTNGAAVYNAAGTKF